MIRVFSQFLLLYKKVLQKYPGITFNEGNLSLSESALV